MSKSGFPFLGYVKEKSTEKQRFVRVVFWTRVAFLLPIRRQWAKDPAAMQPVCAYANSDTVFQAGMGNEAWERDIVALLDSLYPPFVYQGVWRKDLAVKPLHDWMPP